MRNNVGTSYLASVLDLASARKAEAWKDRGAGKTICSEERQEMESLVTCQEKAV